MLTAFAAVLMILGVLSFGVLATAGVALFAALLIPLLLLGLFFRIGFAFLKLAVIGGLALLLIGCII